MNEGVTLLVVDDCPEIVGALDRLLGGPATRILTAADGPSALKAAADFCPDLIVLDIDLPGMSGHEVLMELRRSPSNRSTPVVMLTGGACESGEIYGLNIGADDYIAKPFNPRSLKARVAAHITRDRRGRSEGVK